MKEEVVQIDLNYNDVKTETISFKSASYLFVKRIFDILISILGCILMLPIAIIVKISYVLSGDYNQVFFCQDRIGKNGRLFKFYKFRTMVPNADEVLFKMLEEDLEITKEYKINKKIKDDPRITKVGKILRKLSLDELPQMINILLGDMSLIGNRPYLPREMEDMSGFYEDIIKTKPGLTGYWQVSGRSDISFNRRLELESYYSNNSSLILDAKIFYKTFKVVLFGKGAE